MSELRTRKNYKELIQNHTRPHLPHCFHYIYNLLQFFLNEAITIKLKTKNNIQYKWPHIHIQYRLKLHRIQ